MGELAEMQLDGTMCCDCGKYIGSEVSHKWSAPNLPIPCGDCKKHGNYMVFGAEGKLYLKKDGSLFKRSPDNMKKLWQFEKAKMRRLIERV